MTDGEDLPLPTMLELVRFNRGNREYMRIAVAYSAWMKPELGWELAAATGDPLAGIRAATEVDELERLAGRSEVS